MGVMLLVPKGKYIGGLADPSTNSLLLPDNSNDSDVGGVGVAEAEYADFTTDDEDEDEEEV
jgi:hypothetical protein